MLVRVFRAWVWCGTNRRSVDTRKPGDVIACFGVVDQLAVLCTATVLDEQHVAAGRAL